ncbi:hypothetical protein VP01_10420g1, partial [Puccinia sorghi]
HRSKIIFMLTNLSGDTAKWAQPLNQRVLNKSNPDVTPLTLAKFITSFNSYFLYPERKAVQHPCLRTSNLQLCHLVKPSPPSPTSRPWPCNSETNLKPTAATLSKSADQPTPLLQPTQMQWTSCNEQPPVQPQTSEDDASRPMLPMPASWSYISRLPKEEEPRPFFQTHVPCWPIDVDGPHGNRQSRLFFNKMALLSSKGCAPSEQ